MVSLLLVKGANVKALDKKDRTSLHLAAFMGKLYSNILTDMLPSIYILGHQDCINTIVGSGGDINAKDKKV